MNIATWARRLAGTGRVIIALALLAALWIGTVNGVERASRGADDRRAADRSSVAAGFTTSIRQWVDAGRTEVVSLARSIPAGGGPAAHAAIETFLTTPRTFTRGAVAFEGSTAIAGSTGYDVLVGLSPKACTQTDESGRSTTDTKLADLVVAARGSSQPIVSQIFDVPGDCHSAVGIAAASGAVVVVALGDIADATARLSAGSNGGTRLFLITGDVALEPTLGVVAVPPRVAAFVNRARADGPQRARYPVGDTGDAEVLAALAPATDGWSIVLEQDAALFDIELQNRPSLIVASALTVVFAIVFALVAYFDIRRRRAHRRAEVAKNAFFSIAGHELRTPLTVLKGFAETLAEHWNDVDDNRRRTLVERMVPQTRRLDRLVERLLVAASIQAETNTHPEMCSVDPLSVLAEVAEHFQAEAPLHTFIVNSVGGPSDVHADPVGMRQALEYLVENAIKYSPSGGHITLQTMHGRRGVDVIVEDEGVGLPSDHRRIFDKFVQGESVTKRLHDEGGVGLGLYIVRTLVSEMGGSVRAEPCPGGGARFIVSLRPAPSRSGRVSATAVS